MLHHLLFYIVLLVFFIYLDSYKITLRQLWDALVKIIGMSLPSVQKHHLKSCQHLLKIKFQYTATPTVTRS